MMTNFRLMIWMARRLVSSKSSQGFASFIAWVSVIGMALGVLALVVVNGVVAGFENELSKVISGVNGDIVLYSRGNPVNSPANVEDKIKKWSTEVEAVSPSFMSELMVSGPAGVAGALFEGLDYSSIEKVTRIVSRLKEGRWPAGEGEVVLGEAIARRIGVKVGDTLRLIIPFSGDALNGTTAAVWSQPVAVEAWVTGVVRLGMHQYDSKAVFTTLSWVQKIMSSAGRATNFRIKVRQGADTRKIADTLNQYFGHPYRARDWPQLNKNVFAAIRLEKAVISIILLAIIMVAAFNVVSTLMMMIHDKAQDIAILKAMGMTPRQAFSLFTVIGVVIGSIGIIGGVISGLLLNLFLSSFQWIKLPADIYYLGYLPVLIDWRDVALITAVALFLSTVATLFPSWRVAKLSPLEGLRYE